jgi:16S rRNA G527 N7-methylase RsmG
VSFLHDATARIGLPNVRILGSRAEALARDPRFRGKAELVTARALGIGELMECGLPLVSATGRMALMQSQRGPLDALLPALREGGMRIAAMHEYHLGTGEARRIVTLARA